ncbi:hypothetical protein AB0A98_06665 [Streptomyces chrestomyceticus]|uniref:hypothetical protein n=1 Tax=Streptomyces chrestomyceticus TaxID=68185 RepID=UPI0033F3CA80
MTEQVAIEPIRPYGPLRPLPDWLFWNAGVGGFFTCYCVVPALRPHREHLVHQAVALEAVPA